MFRLERPLPLGLSRRTWFWYLLGFAALLALAAWGDAWASRSTRVWPEPVLRFFEIVTDLGDSTWILVPTLVLLVGSAALAFLVRRKRTPHLALIQMIQIYAFILIGVGLPSLVANLLKRTLGRGRPVLLDSVGSLDFRAFANNWQHEAFPSGHATTIFAFALVVGFLSPRSFPAMLAIAVLVGISRVVVGAHYPSDVIAGAALGLLLAFVVRNLFAARGWLFRIRGDGLITRRPFAAIDRLTRARPKPRSRRGSA